MSQQRLVSRLLIQPMLLCGILHRWLSPRNPQTAPRRILIAHHLLLGDTLMLAPLLAKLREQHPQAEIVMTCPEAHLALFACSPYGVKALAYDPSKASTLIALWKMRGFDLAILPADNRMSWLARALGSRHTIAFWGDRPAYKNWFVDEFRALPDTPTALPDIFASLIKGDRPAPFQTKDWPLPASKPFNLPTTPYAVLHVGAGSKLRLWPAERWQALALWLHSEGITPVWSAGAKETALVARADPYAQFPSYAGKLDLLQLTHLLKQAQLVVCPDTGVAHLSKAVDVPSITLFGPGSATLFGASEFWPEARHMGLSHAIECRNQNQLFKRVIPWVARCSRKIGSQAQQCPRARCMEAVEVDEVILACSKLLNSNI